MKNSRSQNTKQNKQGHNNIPKPEIRDNLDSRGGEEQHAKGNVVTHNKKETRKEKEHQKQKSS